LKLAFKEESLVYQLGSGLVPVGTRSGSNLFDGLRSFNEKSVKLVAEKKVSPVAFGKMMDLHECGIEYNEFLSSRCKDIKVDVPESKQLQEWSRRVPESSHSVVRELKKIVVEQAHAIVGLSALIDALFTNYSELRSEIHRANAHISNAMRCKLPENTKLSHRNLTRRWLIQANTPFVEQNLNELLEQWARSSHVKASDHSTQCVDFLRYYFIKATHPTPVIQSYSCRLTGKNAKNTALLDLPEDVVTILIEFLLDGLGLGHEEIKNGTTENLKLHPTEFWLKLGNNDVVPKGALLKRKEYRADWAVAGRQLIGRAL
ncbi:hypothetical protein ANCCAN_21721, partial [Ancylostoma caninum]